MSELFSIRKAVVSDARGIAFVHIESWKETYPGIMPEEKIASLNTESCASHWESTLSNESNVYVAEVNGLIVGFVSGSKNRFQDNCETGFANNCECELAAIYLLKKYHHLGIGKALFERFVEIMIALGFKTMTVWVAEKNPSKDFYARMGGSLSDSKVLYVLNQPVPLVAYCYTF